MTHCPECKADLPWNQLRKQLGKRFACPGCGVSLGVSTAQAWIFILVVWTLLEVPLRYVIRPHDSSVRLAIFLVVSAPIVVSIVAGFLGKYSVVYKVESGDGAKHG